nr:hypothetical protein DSAG12_01639 [Candidatus Prometheoarchaeum syntrophicum]
MIKSMKKISKYLSSIYNDGGDNNFFGIYKDPYYIQVFGGRKAPKVYLDAVSNAHLLEEREKLSDEKIDKLEEMGFEEEPRSSNFSKEFDFSEQKIPELTDFIVKVLQIYEIDPYKADFEIELD